MIGVAVVRGGTMKQILLLGGMLLLFGCSHPTGVIRIVDPQGNPIVGALVVSEEAPYILNPWRLSVFLSDDQGRAEMLVGTDGHIFKPGYYPVINAVSGDSYPPVHSSFFAPTVVLYPLKRDQVIPVMTNSYVTNEPHEGDRKVGDDEFLIPLGVCPALHVTYNPTSRRLRVQSPVPDLLASNGFYFVGPAGSDPTAVVEGDYALAFYCTASQRSYKVGVRVARQAWHKNVPHHRLQINAAQVLSPGAYLQPEIGCLTALDTKLVGLYKEGKPELYRSPGVKERIDQFRETIPCANEYSTQLIEYLKGYL